MFRKGSVFTRPRAIEIYFAQLPIVKERRRFTDVMEEEQLTKVDKRTLAMGREDFSIYKLHRGEEVEVM